MTRNESGQRLAESVAFLTSSGMRIPFLDKDAHLPIRKTELLEFPISTPAPRGVPIIGLTVRVSTAGELSLTLQERGTTNILDRAGLTVLIR